VPRKQIVDCPHCGNRTGVTVVARHTDCEKVFDKKGEFIDTFQMFYYLTECQTCSRVSLLGTWEVDDDPSDLSKAQLLYPATKKFSKSVPEEIRGTYNEAKKVINISPDAFSVLIRKALEYLCHNQGEKEYNLKKMLDKLVEKRIIPRNLAQMTEAIRLIGNIGAHASSSKISGNEAKVIDEFFVAIIEYVYIAPEKIRHLQDRLDRKA